MYNTTYQLRGNTYNNKEELKTDYGARWNAADRCWIIKGSLSDRSITELSRKGIRVTVIRHTKPATPNAAIANAKRELAADLGYTPKRILYANIAEILGHHDAVEICFMDSMGLIDVALVAAGNIQYKGDSSHY